MIHRDIKPSNILVDDDGRASLLDFGIAKLLNALQTGDRTQSIATPNYAAPEQLLGEPIAVHADIYGLGATLYFLLCGEPPIALEGQSLPVIVDRICHQFPLPPSRVNPGVGMSPDLDAICLKCLQKKPKDRYDTVAELAQDLERLQTGFPVLARSPSQLDYVRHFVRRHRVAVGAGMVVFAAMLFGIALSSWQAGIARQERDVARLEARRLSGLRSAVTTLFRKAVSTDSSLTTRQLFERAATVADEEFRHDPATASTLLQMLGHLHLQSEDYPAARSLLQRVLDMPGNAVAPSVLSDANLDMAHVDFRDRDFGAVRERLAKVGEIWRHSDEDFRNEKLQIATLEAQLARAEGRNDDAIQILKDAIDLAREYWGPNHPETAILLINLGATQYYSGDIPAAIANSAAAYEIYKAIGEDQSPDALNLLANWGLYALRAGRPVEAERRLSDALELRTKLYGASAAQAVLMKNLGLAHMVNGKTLDGMDLLEQSRWMAERYAGPNSHLFVSSTCTLARVWLERNEREAARKALEALPADFYQRDTHWADFCAGLLKLARATPPFSDVDLGRELEALKARGSQRLNYFADLQATYGKLLKLAQENTQAAVALQVAAEAKARARSPHHYEVLALKLEAASALEESGQTDQARELRRAALKQLNQNLGPTHALVRHYREGA